MQHEITLYTDYLLKGYILEKCGDEFRLSRARDPHPRPFLTLNRSILHDVNGNIELWQKFNKASKKLRQNQQTVYSGNKEERPPAWTVSAEVFWKDPLSYSIDFMSPALIRKGIHDKTLHRKIINYALHNGLEVPDNVLTGYQLETS